MNTRLSLLLATVSRIYGSFFSPCSIIKRSASFVIPFMRLVFGSFLIAIVVLLFGLNGIRLFGKRKRERCQGCAAHRLPLTKAKRKACMFRCDSSRRLPSGERGVWGEAPYKISIALTFIFRYGGALRHPPILTNFVEFINKCLLFIFFKKPLDISFLLCYYMFIKYRGV